MPIETQEVLDVLGGRERPELTAKAILARLRRRGVAERGARKELRGVLRDLVAERRIIKTQTGYRLGRRDLLLEGMFVRRAVDAPRAESTDQAVYEGEVIDDAGERWQVTSAVALRGGERVAFQPEDGEARRGDVLQCIAGDRDERIGIFEAERGGGGQVRPYRDAGEPWRVRIAKRDRAGARPGEVVVVTALARHGHGGRTSSGRVTECLGMPGDVEADFRAVAWRHRLPLAFPPEVIAEAERIPESLDPAEIARRLDLRDRAFVTIDPSDARDHDDAVFVEPMIEAKDPPLRLWVAIADVSHYVPEGSALDREALVRGNSVYFPGRVIPMLPERISGDLCSLRPDRDRLAIVAELSVDRQGGVTDASFHRAVIRSRARLSYAQAAGVIDAQGGESESQELRDGLSDEVVEQLRLLGRVAHRLEKRRFAEGSVDFDVREGRVVLDEEGRPKAIVEAERTGAHRAIEDAMLAANRAVASHLSRVEVPCIYRIHETPEPLKLEALSELLETFGLLGGPREPRPSAEQGERMPSGRGQGARRKGGAGRTRRSRPDLTPIALNQALSRARGKPEQALVNLVALRSMKQARYSHENQGHFALGFDSYLHFTSPIRRYADLVVHRRLVERLLKKRPAPGIDDQAMQRIAKRVSFRERVAVEAEREILDLKKCAFMKRYVGVEFGGRVSGVSIHGLFVTLDDFFVDGLVHASALGEALELDERLHQLVGRRSGHRYRLGDPLRIRVEEVDLIRGRIRFAAAEPVIEGAPRLRDSPPGKKPRGTRKGKGKPGGGFKSGRRSGPRSRRRGAPNPGRGRR